MSYCVHCGVDLAPSEQACPLCHTLVQDPHCEWVRPATLPYPETIDVIDTRIDRRYARSLAALVMAAIGVVALLLDLLGGGGITWSPYVMGSMGLIYAGLIVPLLFKFSRPYAYITIDFIAIGAFLLMTALLTGSLIWYVGLFIPLFILSVLILLGIVLSFRRKEWPMLDRLAAICTLVGIYLLSMEALVSMYWGQPLRFVWSFYAAVPTTVLAIMLVIAERNKKLKNEIKKRLFI